MGPIVISHRAEINGSHRRPEAPPCRYISNASSANPLRRLAQKNYLASQRAPLRPRGGRHQRFSYMQRLAFKKEERQR